MKVSYNWGRWIASCPSPGCLGVIEVHIGQSGVVCDCQDTQICDHTNPQLVNLVPERQALICGTEIPLEWPADPEAIIAICARRALRHRNWHPGETIDELKAENLTHGVGLPRVTGDS